MERLDRPRARAARTARPQNWSSFLSWDWTLSLDRFQPHHPDGQRGRARERSREEDMNHLLITQIAQDEIAERVRTAERERLARMARGRRPVAATTRSSGLVPRRLWSVLTSWRHRAGRTAAAAMPHRALRRGPRIVTTVSAAGGLAGLPRARRDVGQQLPVHQDRHRDDHAADAGGAAPGHRGAPPRRRGRCVARERLPRSPMAYLHLTVMATLNIVVPFSLVTWAELSVPSSLAAILTAAVPLFAVVIAAGDPPQRADDARSGSSGSPSASSASSCSPGPRPWPRVARRRRSSPCWRPQPPMPPPPSTPAATSPGCGPWCRPSSRSPSPSSSAAAWRFGLEAPLARGARRRGHRLAAVARAPRARASPTSPTSGSSARGAPHARRPWPTCCRSSASSSGVARGQRDDRPARRGRDGARRRRRGAPERPLSGAAGRPGRECGSRSSPPS